MENDLMYLAKGLGFDGEPIESLEKLFLEYNVVDVEQKEKMLKEFEEGYFDW
jgi:hypothetical protein